MKTTQIHMAAMMAMAMTLCIGAGIIGCKKKSSSNNQTSSGGGANPVPSPTATQHKLALSKIGTGSGSVNSTPAGIACGTTCNGSFNEGAVVALAVVPQADSVFAEWSGACSGAGTCQVKLSSDTAVTARFEKKTPQMTVTKTGNGGGTITSSPAGISCGLDCTETYTLNAQITLTAAVDGAGSKFAGWSGACSGTGSCVVTMDSGKSVSAEFDKVTPEVIVAKAGNGDGTIQSSPAGITCGTDCSEVYDFNTAVQLTATPVDQFSEFVGWSGDCTGSGVCSVTADKGRNVTATFQKVQKSLAVTKSGMGQGTVTSSPAGIACGTDCSENYLLNTVVTLTQTPQDVGSEFDHWNGACSGSAGCSVTMSDARSVEAVFRQRPLVTVIKTGDGAGTVTSAPAGISCGTDCSENYSNGTIVALTAVPADRFSEFAGWSGDCTGTGACSVTATQARTVTALFQKVKKTLSVTKSGTSDGTVTSSPGSISCGATCSAPYLLDTSVTLSQTPVDAFTNFIGWSGACSGTGACSVTMSDVKSVNAQFDKVSFNGTWLGKTNQGKDMSFIVENDKVRIYSATYTVTGLCNYTGWSLTTYDPGSGIPILTDHTFGNSIGSFQISGAFSSGTHATGTLAVVSDECGTFTMTWTADESAGAMSLSTHGNVARAGTYSGVTSRP